MVCSCDRMPIEIVYLPNYDLNMSYIDNTMSRNKFSTINQPNIGFRQIY